MTDIVIRSQLGIPVIDVRGELYKTNADELQTQVRRSIAAGNPDIIVDLSDCMLMDSTGLGQLVSCWRECQNADGTLKLLGPLSPSIRQKFEITKLDTVFDIFDNEPDAVASFP